jgi:hypothetical protein
MPHNRGKPATKNQHMSRKETRAAKHWMGKFKNRNPKFETIPNK